MPIEFVPAICPNCGGDLRVPEDREKIKCMYCGFDLIIRDTRNDLSDPRVENWLMLADSVLKSNPEEAYQYYSKTLEIEPKNWNAWFGKAKAAGSNAMEIGNISSLSNPRIEEVINEIQKAIEFCPESEKEELKNNAKREIFILACSFYINSFGDYVDSRNYDRNAFANLFNRSELFFSLINNYLSLKSLQNDDFIICAEMGRDKCKELIDLIPNNDRNGFYEKELQKKYQYYINVIREMNPKFQSTE